MSPLIPVDDLRIGIYVQLDLNWTEHPFSFNSFKIRNEDQIRALKGLGLTAVRYDPHRSSVRPAQRPPAASKPMEPAPAPAPPVREKQARIEYLRNYRRAVASAELALQKSVRTVRTIFSQLPSSAAANEAKAFVSEVAATFLGDPDATIHAMGGREPDDGQYHHGLNVCVIAMIMAKGLGMSTEDGALVGLGALLHDIGLAEVPSRVLRKTEPLTDAELRLRQRHCEAGAEMARSAGLGREVVEIIVQHHELMDGTGYPAGLKGDRITPMARLVEVANRYDSLCNPTMPAKAMSPHEALSWMFAQQSAKHDPVMVRALIRSLGVYPPGTAVHLTNGATGLVTSVNPDRPLKPTLVIYEPAIPREEAIVVNLDLEPDVHIAHALRPMQIPKAICDYLRIRRHVSYYFGEGAMPPGT